MQPHKNNQVRLSPLSSNIKRSGFSLAELILAASIMAVAFAGLAALNIGCIVLNDANRNLTVAMTHAQYVVEEIEDAILQYPIIDVDDLKNKINNGDWNWNSVEIAAKGLTALTNENITTSINPAFSTNPLGVNVEVAWVDRAQRQREINIDTLITHK